MFTNTTKRIAKVCIFCFLIYVHVASAFEKPRYLWKEADYRDYWVSLYTGKTEQSVVNSEDKTRTDILTERFAIEVEWATKWKESVGQALHYGIIWNRTPGIVFIVKENKELKYVKYVVQMSMIHKLSIAVWLIFESDGSVIYITDLAALETVITGRK